MNHSYIILLRLCFDVIFYLFVVSFLKSCFLQRVKCSGGVLMYKCYTGMCRPKGLVFHRRSLDKGLSSKTNPQIMGMFFKENTLKYGSDFPKLSKFSEVFGSLRKRPKILNNWPIFCEKSLEKGTFFGQNDPQKRVRVSRLGPHIPVQPKVEQATPPHHRG